MSSVATLRSAARAALNALERAAHPLRRNLARGRIRKLDPASILFICHGNICRSPYASAVMARLSPATRVASAGFFGPGRPSPAAAIGVAARRGADLTPHRSQVLTAVLGRDHALVVVMDAGQARGANVTAGVPHSRILVLGDLDPEPIERRTIVDPVDKAPEVFEECYARIDRCLGELAALLRRG